MTIPVVVFFSYYRKTLQKSATSAWKEEISLRPIFTSCKELDAAVSNGIPTGVITEFCGPPGCGKTQICLQLCANVQYPSDLGGLNGEAVFIDTNRGYSPYRFREIASAQSQCCQRLYQMKLFNSTPPTSTQSLEDKFMNGIKLYFVLDYIQLLAVIYNLQNVLAENPFIRLIVIDSFSFLFRRIEYAGGDLIRTQILYDALDNLQKLANQFSCAVVLTNELTTRIADPSQIDKYLVPSMGDSYSHRVTQQVTLAREDTRSEIFCASIDKSLYSPEIVVKFRITKDGIQSV